MVLAEYYFDLIGLGVLSPNNNNKTVNSSHIPRHPYNNTATLQWKQKIPTKVKNTSVPSSGKKKEINKIGWDNNMLFIGVCNCFFFLLAFFPGV